MDLRFACFLHWRPTWRVVHPGRHRGPSGSMCDRGRPCRGLCVPTRTAVRLASPQTITIACCPAGVAACSWDHPHVGALGWGCVWSEAGWGFCRACLYDGNILRLGVLWRLPHRKGGSRYRPIVRPHAVSLVRCVSLAIPSLGLLLQRIKPCHRRTQLLG